VSLSQSAVLVETFTVIHGGAEIDDSVVIELLEAVTGWAASAESGVTRVVEVWAAPWRWIADSCLAIAVAFGGPAYATYLPGADNLVAAMEAVGVAVRHRKARQSMVDDAEL
jgi:hypothetical protein